jgi:hypothetical protein
MKAATVHLDSGSSRALLAIAAHEGLLLKNDRLDDGIFEKIRDWKYPNWLKEHVLTQLTLSPTAHIYLHDYRFLTGELLDNGHLIFQSAPDKKEIIPLSLPVEIIDAMLVAQGYDIPSEEFFLRLKNTYGVLQRHDAYFKKLGKPSPNIGDRIVSSWGLNSKYSKRDFEVADELQSAWRTSEPIFDAMTEYGMLATQCAHSGDLLGIPSLPTSPFEIANPIPTERKITDTESYELCLFRIAAECLGTLPRGRTLKDSIRLANEPAMVDLRTHLLDWKSELVSGNLDALEIIQREVQDANTALSNAGKWDTVGNVVTWLSGPIVLGELLQQAPPVLGFTVATLGKYASIRSGKSKSKYHWATFNSRSKAE